MIIDVLKYSEIYYSISPFFEKAFEFIRKFEEEQLNDGKYDIKGDDIYAFVMSYDQKKDTEINWETHDRYIDIQYIAEGEEIIYYTELQNLITETPYDREKDIEFHKLAGTKIPLHMKKGDFAIFFPQDGHAPGYAVSEPLKGRRVVIKVKI